MRISGTNKKRGTEKRQKKFALGGISLLLLLAIGFSGMTRFRSSGDSLSSGAVSTARSDAETVVDPQHPCGAVSLCLVAHWLGAPFELDASTRSVRADALGRTSMSELLDGARSMGFEAQPIRLGTGAIKHVTLPMILYVHQSHFVAALPTGSEAVVVVDPPNQPEVLTEDELRSSSQWSGEMVLVASDRGLMTEALARIGVRQD